MKAIMRKRINSFIAELESRIEDFSVAIDEMQDAYADKSERWQDSEMGEAAQEEIDNFENAKGEIESLLETIQSLIEDK